MGYFLIAKINVRKNKVWVLLRDQKNQEFKVVLLMSALVAYGIFLVGAWKNLPNPYIDESFFVPAAQAFADHYHFHAISLDPERALHWMPWGYAVACGLFMKVFGVDGLEGARLFSSVVYVFIIWFVWRISNRLTNLQSVILVSPFLTMPLLILSRIGRMESLFILLALAIIWSLLLRRCVMALALAFLAMLVHPNGIYLIGCASVFCIFLFCREKGDLIRGINRLDWVLFAISLVAMLIYIVYELHSYDAFVTDMRYQFERKARVINWGAPLTLLTSGLLSGSAVLAWVRPNYERVVFLTMGSVLMLSRLIGQELWYSPGYIVGLACIVVGWLSWTPVHLRMPNFENENWYAKLFSILWLIGLSGVFILSVFVLGWHGARLQSLHYAVSDAVSSAQVEAIKVRLTSHILNSGINTVSCVPAAECMLLLNSAEESKFALQFRNPITEPPMGQHCVWVARSNYERSTDENIRLTAGVIKRFEIKPCPHQWPTKDAFESWYFQ